MILIEDRAFGELTARQWHDIVRLRIEVFVVEQRCPYPELDGRDIEPTTRHCWVPGAAVGLSELPVAAYARALANHSASDICSQAQAQDVDQVQHPQPFNPPSQPQPKTQAQDVDQVQHPQPFNPPSQPQPKTQAQDVDQVQHPQPFNPPSQPQPKTQAQDVDQVQHPQPFNPPSQPQPKTQAQDVGRVQHAQPFNPPSQPQPKTQAQDVDQVQHADPSEGTATSPSGVGQVSGAQHAYPRPYSATSPLAGEQLSGSRHATTSQHANKNQQPGTVIGRIVCHPSARRRGLGGLLVKHFVGTTAGPWSLNAQARLEGWYASMGFSVTGEPFDDWGMPHVPMRLEIGTGAAYHQRTRPSTNKFEESES